MTPQSRISLVMTLLRNKYESIGKNRSKLCFGPNKKGSLKIEVKMGQVDNEKVATVLVNIEGKDVEGPA